MSVAIVRIPVADLRKEPSHRSERISQLTFGHKVHISKREGEFIRVTGEDDYGGWMLAAYTCEFTLTDAEAQIVCSPFAQLSINSKKLKLTETVLMPYGALVAFDRRTEKHLDWSTSSAVSIKQGILVPQTPLSNQEMLAEARSLCGVPYLWGGGSGFGFDCSGFVQALFRRRGVQLPRDSKDQEPVGKQVEVENAEPGDIIFFPGHVAICLGDDDIVHASRTRGTVAVESLNPKSARFRGDLLSTYSSVRRIKL